MLKRGLLTLIISLCLAGCGGGDASGPSASGTVPVTLSFGVGQGMAKYDGGYQPGEIRTLVVQGDSHLSPFQEGVNFSWQSIADLLIADALAALPPAIVDSVTVAITGPGMTPMVASSKVQGGTAVTFNFNVPIGNSRVFTVDVFDVAGSVLAQGTVAVASLQENVAVTLNVPIIPVETVPPVLSLRGAAAVSTPQGSPYNDLGAVAQDNYDGNISANIVTVSTVNTAIIGIYTVNYNVSDAAGNAAVQMSRIVNVVPAVNPAPVVANDVGTTAEDTVLTTINVLANDTSPSGQPLTVSAFSAASTAGGTVTNNANGTFNYTPALNFNGTDTFSYTASDGIASAVGTVTITVTAVNDAPTFIGVPSIVQTAPFQATVLTLAGTGTSDVDLNAVTLSYQWMSGATPIVGATAATYTLTAAEVGQAVKCVITANDGTGAINATAVATTNIVSIGNTTPVVTNDTGTTLEDTVLTTINVLLNDTDPGGQALTVSAFSAASTAGGTVTNNANGTFNYTPALNFNGTDTFSYTASDGIASAVGTVTITVSAVNDAPVITNAVPFGFNPETTYATGALARAVASGDFNNDGSPDMVVANQDSHSIGIYINDGTGAFGAAGAAAAATLPTNAAGGISSPTSVVTTDLNGDGNVDIITANANSSNIGVFMGTGTGAFVAVVNYSTGAASFPASVRMADFNGDGNLDVVVAVSAPANNLAILLGDGLGAFAAPVNVVAGTGPNATTTGDFNNDGKIDLAVANSTSRDAVVLLNNGVGNAVSFAAGVSYGAWIGPRDIRTADFNNDGNLDLVVVNGQVNASFPLSVFYGSANGTFGAAVNYSTNTPGIGATSVAVADYNADGNVDLAVSYWNGPVVLLLGNGGNGAGAFVRQVGSYPVTGTSQQIITADFNGDGSADLAMANRGAPSNVSVLLNKGQALAQTVTGNTVLNTTITATDVDVATVLQFSILSQAANGVATINATTAAVSYTANLNYSGTDSFTVQVSDGAGATDTIVVSVSVAPIPVTIVSGAGANISGANCNTVWPAGVYDVRASMFVATGCSLTVDAGAIVKFAVNALLTVGSGGTLTVNGTAGNHATFTSIKDDTIGGDTNGDGAATTPAAGDWAGITYAAGSLGSIGFADFNYVGRALSVQSSRTIGDVTVQNANSDIFVSGAGTAPVMNNVSISTASAFSGLYVNTGALGSYSNFTISSTSPSSSGLYVRGSGSYSNFTINSAGYGVSLVGGTPSSLTNFTINNVPNGAFSVSSGGVIPVGSSIILGAGVSNSVIFSGQGVLTSDPLGQVAVTGTPSVWEVPSNFAVPNGQALTVDAGAIVKFAANTWLSVGGTLTVNGTAGNHATFTSIKDDTIGGDTNGDGAATTPAAGDWAGITYAAGSLGSIGFADFNYVGRALSVQSSRTIGDVTVQNANSDIFVSGAGTAPVMNNIQLLGSGLVVSTGATGSYNNFIIDNAVATLTGIPTAFNNITFQNYAAIATPLLLNFGATTATFNNLTFSSPLTTGFHIGGTGAGNTLSIASVNAPLAMSTLFAANNTVTWTVLNTPPVAGINFAQSGLSFDGVAQYVDLGAATATSLQFAGLSPFSIEVWIKPAGVNTATQQMIVAKSNFGGVGEYTLFYDGTTGKVSFSRGNLAIVSSTIVLPAGKFSHIAATYDGINIRLYINGVADGVVANGTIPTTTNTVLIGARNIAGAPGHFFSGTVDEVRIWNLARTQAEIQANKDFPLAGNELGLVGYWLFDEAIGTTTSDFSATVNHGTLSPIGAGPAWVPVDNPAQIFTRVTNTYPAATLGPYPDWLGGSDVQGGVLVYKISTLPVVGALTQFDGTPMTAPNTVVTDPFHRVSFVAAAGATGIPYDTYAFTATDPQGAVSTPETVTIDMVVFGNLTLTQSLASIVTGGVITITAQLLDGAGVGIAGQPVQFDIPAGSAATFSLNGTKTITVLTGASGFALADVTDNTIEAVTVSVTAPNNAAPTQIISQSFL